MRYIHILFFIFLQVYTVNSQKIDKILIPNELDNQITQHQLVRPNIFSLVQISPIAWYNYLSVHYIESKNVTIELPNENGEIEKYDIIPASVMEHELCKKYNHIKSFKGYNQNDKNTTVRLSITPDNFHAVIRNNHKTIYIDPYSSKSNSIYITYNIKDDEESMRLQNLMCGTSSHSLGDRPKWGVRQSPQGTPFQLRKYRLALACTGEWGALRGTKERIIEDMVTFVERANIVFEAEIGITLELINRNDELIHLDGTTDGYENPQTGASLVGQNTTVLNIRIGSNAYDIGHVLSPCFDVEG